LPVHGERHPESFKVVRLTGHDAVHDGLSFNDRE
jgi:hypothetical protein